MLKVDSHLHFWVFEPVRDSWINDEMRVIQRDFLPKDLEPILKANGINSGVAVQVNQTEEENDFLLDLARSTHFIQGVVGWVDLQADNIAERLAYYSKIDLMKGFRHMLQSEEDRMLMLQPAFINGISLLKEYGFTYDILILQDQLEYVSEFVGSCPDQKFVIDHLAKPDIKDKKIDDWAKDMRAIAQHENVYCKVSGLVTEADWKNWKVEDFYPYLDVVFEAFGANRLMYGSDWPVCQVAANYEQTKGVVAHYTAKLSANEQADFWGGNAASFYNLK